VNIHIVDVAFDLLHGDSRGFGMYRRSMECYRPRGIPWKIPTNLRRTDCARSLPCDDANPSFRGMFVKGMYQFFILLLGRSSLGSLGGLGGLGGGSGASLGDGGEALLLVDSSEKSLVILLLSDLLGVASGLLVELLSASAEGDGSDETLDLGGDGAIALTLLSGDGATDDELTDIILLGQVEELADARGALGTKTLSDGLISNGGDLGISLLDDDNVDDGHFGGDDASTNRLSTAVSPTTVSVVTIGTVQKQAHTVVRQNSLLHGETLLVESSSDTEDISLVLISQEITRHLLTDALIVEGTVLLLVIDFVHLGGSSGGVGNVDLHKVAQTAITCKERTFRSDNSV